MDVRAMFDSDYLGAWDIQGRDAAVEIERVVAGTLTSRGNKKTRKPIVYFKGKKKGLALNKTNLKIIAGMYGYEAAAWVGKRITLYATKTTFGADEVDCIRVRPGIPTGKVAPIAPDAPEPEDRGDAPSDEELAAAAQ